MSTPTRKFPSSTRSRPFRFPTLPVANQPDSDIDISFFVLAVDLWNADGTSEVNLVKHSATSPSISTAMSSSYPPPPQNLSPSYSGYPYGQPVGYPVNNYYGGNQVPPYGYPPYYGGGNVPPPNMPAAAAAPPGAAGGSGGMFTRNLIGSLSASAFRLNDPDDKIGVWFILQDLSVRTEGVFRFVNCPDPSGSH